MTTDEKLDGPDGLHRLHRMLAATYGVEVPADDYHPVVVLLDALGVSLRGIVELLSRFTRFPRGQLINDVNGLVAGDIPVAEAQMSRVKQSLIDQGYNKLLSEASPKWVSGATDLDPLDPSIPTEVKRYWDSLLRIFPRGLQTPKDYVTVLAVLQDEQLPPMDMAALMSGLISRPRELIARDINRLGTLLIPAEADKVTLRRQLGLE